MIQIVQHRTDAPFTTFVVELRIFQFDGQAFGFIMPYLGDYGGTEAEAAAKLGKPVLAAFREALGACRAQGLDYLFVNDPNNLFPPGQWPAGGDAPEWQASGA